MMCFNPEKKMSFFSVISNKLDGDMLVTMVKSMELLLHKGKYHLLYLWSNKLMEANCVNTFRLPIVICDNW